MRPVTPAQERLLAALAATTDPTRRQELERWLSLLGTAEALAQKAGMHEAQGEV